MHLNLVGRTKHKGSKTCGQTQFSSQLPTPFLRPAHPPKQRSNPGWFAPWSANKAVTWTLQDTSTNPRTQGHVHWHWQHIGKCTHARIQHCLRGTVTMATSVEQEGKWPLWFGREATRTWRKSTTSKDFFDNFGREFSLPTNWFGKLETSWIHFCKKIAATYKLQISPTFRPIFQIGPRTTMRTRSKSRLELAIGPLARDRNRPFVEERSRESGVDRGDDGLARRVCLLFRLSSVSFSFISWTKMFTEEHESVNFEVFVWWAVNFDFFPTLLKSMENSTCSSRILWHFQAQASTWCSFGRAVSQRIK